MEVPENECYLAVNSAKRNPNTPRGAQFPAHPPKQGWTSTLDDDDDDDDDGLNDERIPALPASPPTTAPAGFLNEGSTSHQPAQCDFEKHPQASILQTCETTLACRNCLGTI